MDFTNEEKARINALYGNDFKEITPEDAALIARWEQHKAEQNAVLQAKTNAIKLEALNNIENANEIATIAKNNLKALKDVALARLERIDNGK
jgi:hypothetical protein